jgi:predicted protein tyrosine phosphatase
VKIIVCPLSRLKETLNRSGAKHVITLIRDEELIKRERDSLLGHGLELDKHLWIEVDDIDEELDGMIAPTHAHLEQLISFARKWDGTTPMVVHCYAGISRSTAMAFILACISSPTRNEMEIARRLRIASPTARPNKRLIAIADSYLKRDGRMIRAVSMIGEGIGAYEGDPFTLCLDG